MSKRSLKIHALPRQLKVLGWQRLLYRWSALIAATTDEGDDVPYWYGERTLTGLLGAAAWRLPRGWALEEFTGLRGKRLKTKSGRGDLWLGLGNRTYTIEAKVRWPPGNPRNAVQYARAAIMEASEQLWQLSRQYRLGTLIAVCYLVPCPMKDGPYAKRDRGADMIATVKREFRGGRWLAASYFPNYEPPTDNGRVYPGVILIGRVVSWGKNTNVGA